MSGMLSPLAELLAECDGHSIRLLVGDDDGLTIDAPQEALTPGLLDWLKALKAELLTQLASNIDDPIGQDLSPIKRSNPPTPVCRCGSTTWHDVPIHDGQSVRRDCGRCGRFIDFPIWYRNDTGHNGQHPIG